MNFGKSWASLGVYSSFILMLEGPLFAHIFHPNKREEGEGKTKNLE
jgi:hypothetical protein